MIGCVVGAMANGLGIPYAKLKPKNNYVFFFGISFLLSLPSILCVCVCVCVCVCGMCDTS